VKNLIDNIPAGLIKRYEIINDCLLLNADCYKIIKYLEKYVGGILADPPYGINFKGKTRSTKKGDIYAGGSYRVSHKPIIGDSKPFNPSFLLSKKPTILWGANNYCSHLRGNNGWLVWHKDGGIKGFAMSECELAWTNFLKSIKHISHMWNGFRRDSETGEKVLHPTQKPIEVMKWCISHLPKDCQVILDPFMGSGTTLVACAKMNRKGIGIELDEGYFDIACKRVEDAYRQPDMFYGGLK